MDSCWNYTRCTFLLSTTLWRTKYNSHVSPGLDALVVGVAMRPSLLLLALAVGIGGCDSPLRKATQKVQAGDQVFGIYSYNGKVGPSLLFTVSRQENGKGELYHVYQPLRFRNREGSEFVWEPGDWELIVPPEQREERFSF